MITLDSARTSFKLPMPAKATPINSRVSSWLASLAYPLGRHLVLPSYFRRIEVKGQEYLPTAGPVVLAPTHRSRWDALMVPYAAGRHVTGRDLRFMVTSDEMNGLQGWFIRELGGFPVNPKQPAIASLRHGVDLLVDGEMLVIFPEGNIFQDDRVHPLKPGLARLALQAETNHPGLGVKILPMNIRYYPSIPRWRGHVRIQIGCPLHVADYVQGTSKKEALHLTTDLAAALQTLDGK